MVAPRRGNKFRCFKCFHDGFSAERLQNYFVVTNAKSECVKNIPWGLLVGQPEDPQTLNTDYRTIKSPLVRFTIASHGEGQVEGINIQSFNRKRT